MRQRHLTYCQELAKQLDSQDTKKSRSKRDSRNHGQQPHTHKLKQQQQNNDLHSPSLLNLPAELRQEILYLTLDDTKLRHTTKIKRAYQTRVRVCKTFQADLQVVRRRWLARKRWLISQEQNGEAIYIKPLITDLMATVTASAAAATMWNNLPGVQRKKARRNQNYIARRVTEKFAAHDAHARMVRVRERRIMKDERANAIRETWAARWEVKTAAGVDEVKAWRKLRKAREGGVEQLRIQHRHKFAKIN